MADSLHLNPVLLGIPMTLVASCAGMMPMATPPNAIVFCKVVTSNERHGSDRFVLNLIAIALIMIFFLAGSAF